MLLLFVVGDHFLDSCFSRCKYQIAVTKDREKQQILTFEKLEQFRTVRNDLNNNVNVEIVTFPPKCFSSICIISLFYFCLFVVFQFFLFVQLFGNGRVLGMHMANKSFRMYLFFKISRGKYFQCNIRLRFEVWYYYDSFCSFSL